MQISPQDPFSFFAPQTEPELQTPIFKLPAAPTFQVSSVTRPSQPSEVTKTRSRTPQPKIFTPSVPRQSQRLSGKRAQVFTPSSQQFGSQVDHRYNQRLNLAPQGIDTSKIGFVGNIEELSKANQNFRTVLYSSDKLQLVLMSLKPGEEIGSEMHDDTDQFFRIETGTGIVVINGVSRSYEDGTSIQVPRGNQHNVIAATETKLYTLYSPPHHPATTIQATKPQQ